MQIRNTSRPGPGLLVNAHVVKVLATISVQRYGGLCSPCKISTYPAAMAGVDRAGRKGV
jgi:hypothetical protein